MVFTTKLRPSEIRFTQDSIKGCFQEGGAVNDAISEMKNGVLRPEEFPVMNVVRLNEKYYSIDNRRLYVFRVAEYEGYISEVQVRIVPEERLRPERFTTNNDGISVSLRQGRTHKHYKESWFMNPDERGNINIPATQSLTPRAPNETHQVPLSILLPKQAYPTPNQTYQMPKLYSTNFEPISDNTGTDSIAVPPRRPYSATPYNTPSSNNTANNSVKSSTNNSIINHTTVQQPETIPNVEPDKKPGLFRRFLDCCCCCSC